MPPKNSRPVFESYPEHPLFPVEDGEPTPQVDFITITRKDRGVMVCGPVLRADELTSTDQIFERFGGGMYELIARARGTVHPDLPNKISKRRWIVLAGRSKPLSQDPTADELRASDMAPPATATSSSTAAAPAPAPAGGMGDGVLVAILQMQQQASQQFMTLMLEMMKSGKSEAAESARAQAESTKQFVQMMMTMSSQQQQSMLAMMTAMMQARGGGPEELEKYAALLKSIGFGGKASKAEPSSDSVGAIVENLADIVQGGVQLMQSRGLPQPNGQESPPAPPGSAASVLDPTVGIP